METTEIEGINGRPLVIVTKPVRDENDEITGYQAETREWRLVPIGVPGTTGTVSADVIAKQQDELRSSGLLAVDVGEQIENNPNVPVLEPVEA